jgi:hypothetical protein
VKLANRADRATPRAPPDRIVLSAKLGAVAFDHLKHAGQAGVDCETCHHPSQPQKPLAAENQACRDCHTTPASPPLTTSRQGAFHDAKAKTGTCIDCHQQAGEPAPVKCLACHKKK